MICGVIQHLVKIQITQKGLCSICAAKKNTKQQHLFHFLTCRNAAQLILTHCLEFDGKLDDIKGSKQF